MENKIHVPNHQAVWVVFPSHFFGIWSTCWKSGNYSCRNKHPIFRHPTQVQKEFLHRFAGGPVRLKLASELFRNPTVKSVEVKQPGWPNIFNPIDPTFEQPVLFKHICCLGVANRAQTPGKTGTWFRGPVSARTCHWNLRWNHSL